MQRSDYIGLGHQADQSAMVQHRQAVQSLTRHQRNHVDHMGLTVHGDHWRGHHLVQRLVTTHVTNNAKLNHFNN